MGEIMVKKELILTQTPARKNKINKFPKFSLQKRTIFFTFVRS
jgi:hypothetical protein